MFRRRFLRENKFRTLFWLSVLCTTMILLYVHMVPDVLKFSPGQFSMKKSARWIVLDDVTATCDDVSTYTRQYGWAVVIVTDKEKNILGCSFPRCFQLTWKYVTTNMKHFETSRLLHNSSKLFGYLFAIQNGANIILDGDCSIQVEDITKTFRAEEIRQSGLWYNDTNYFNPFSHFGIPDALPKELWIKQQRNRSLSITEFNSGFFYITEWSSVAIRQGVTISQSTCVKMSEAAINKQNIFPYGSPVSAGYPSFAPFSTGPTVFYEEVFVLLFIPPNVELDVGKLFRSIWFNQLNKFSLITPAFYFVHGQRDLHTECSHSTNLSRYYKIAESISTCLGHVMCDDPQCMVNVLKQLSICFIRELCNITDDSFIPTLVEAWTSDLLKLGINTTVNTVFRVQAMYKTRYQIPNQIGVFHNVSSSFSGRMMKDIISLCGVNEEGHFQKMTNPLIDDIVLIIGYNYRSVFPSLGINEFIHRQYFKYIVYCVPSLGEFDEFAKAAGFDYVTFIDAMAEGWKYFYQCVTAAMNLNLPVKGYLQVGDDVLLNDWNLVSIPRDEMIMSEGEIFVDLYKIDPKYPWDHWKPAYGQKATQTVIEELKNVSAFSLDDMSNKYPPINISNFARTFLQNLEENIKPNFVAYGNVDIFYVPQRFRDEYVTATKLFHKHRCMSEIALRVIYLGLKPPGEKKYYFQGRELWEGDRFMPWRFFNASDIFLHPLKWISDGYTKEGRAFICQRFFKLL